MPNPKTTLENKSSHKLKALIWVLAQNKILTQEILIIRGCAIPPGCKLCNNDLIETRDSILLNCQYARHFWRTLAVRLRITRIPDNTTTILTAWRTPVQLSDSRISWDTTWAAGVWALWCERN